jgi:cell division protease FtsH
MFLPEEDRYSHSRQRLESQISTLFGGRVAEELIYGHESVTTGASNDIEHATEIARSMVTKWGLSDKMGPLSYGEEDGEIFLGHSVTQHKSVSDDTANSIDQEIRRIIDGNYERAVSLIKENMDKLHIMAKALMKYETLDSKQLDDIMAGEEPHPPEDWMDDEPRSGTAAKQPRVDNHKDSDPIGGPAGEH